MQATRGDGWAGTRELALGYKAIHRHECSKSKDIGREVFKVFVTTENNLIDNWQLIIGNEGWRNEDRKRMKNEERRIKCLESEGII